VVGRRRKPQRALSLSLAFRRLATGVGQHHTFDLFEPAYSALEPDAVRSLDELADGCSR